VVHKLEGKWDRSADNKVLSFDIECAGTGGNFPTAHADPVIQICNVVALDNTSVPRHIGFSLGSAEGSLSPLDRELERAKHINHGNAMAAWEATGSPDAGKPVPPEFVVEGWGENMDVFQYPLVRDDARVVAMAAGCGVDDWSALHGLVQTAILADCARLGGQRMRQLLVRVDRIMRVERHGRDRHLHAALRAAEPWRFQTQNTPAPPRRAYKKPRVSTTTDTFRYGFLDVAHLLTGQRGSTLTLVEQLVVLSYFFPRLRAALSRGTYVAGDDWYSSRFHIARRSQSPLSGALEPSRVRPPFCREGEDPDADMSAVERTEKACQEAAAPPTHDGVLPGTVPLVDTDFGALLAVGTALPAAPSVPKPPADWAYTATPAKTKDGSRKRGRPSAAPENISSSTGPGARYAPARVLQVVLLVLTDLLAKEARMLGDWAQFVRCLQPHFLTGYNILTFDIPYLRERAAVLGVRTFTYLGTMHTPSRISRKIFTSRGTGTQKRIEVVLGGITCITDMYTITLKDVKLASYKLNAVAAHFLGRVKNDMAYYDITPCWLKDDAGRSRLLRYCDTDAWLPLLLLRKRKVLFVKKEMVRVTGVTMHTLMTRGQGVLTHSMLVRLARVHGRLCPVLVGGRKSDVQFQGATVVAPKRGFYKNPVTTLDFASLYPSIMLAHNLCYSTWVHPEDQHRLRPEQMEYAPFARGGASGACFVRAVPAVAAAAAGGGAGAGIGTNKTTKTTNTAAEAATRGLLPQLLKQVLSARTQAKRDKKACGLRGDETGAAVMDGRQLALKVVANSVYGFLSAFILRNVEIGATVTYYGRLGITETTDITEAYFCKRNGFALDASVVYGDTDSIMVHWGAGVSVREADALTKLAECLLNKGYAAANRARAEGTFFPLVPRTLRADAVLGRVAPSQAFVPGNALGEWTGYIGYIVIEYEKLYKRFLLMNKKRYAGLKIDPLDFERPPAPGTEIQGTVACSGIENVRRDTPAFTRDTLTRAVDLLVLSTVEDALAYVVARGEELLRGEVFMSALVISKGLTKLYYANAQQHVKVYLDRLRSNPDTAPVVGDRVPFVYCVVPPKAGRGAPKAASAASAAFDPALALRQGRRLDYRRYFDKCFSAPVARLFLYVLRDASDIHWTGASRTQDLRNRAQAVLAVSKQMFGGLAAVRPPARHEVR
jgi:DNA polymerase elongation subunit (family B)